MGTASDAEYTEELVALLGALWGEGFLSPGGPEEVAELLSGLDLRGKRVLDVGCGAGGIDLLLARDHGAAEVVGVDVEAPALRCARALIERHGLGERVSFRQVEPGPLPFPDECFDVVFSKDAVIHIPDKDAWCRDAYRVLRPGGWVVASDWMRRDEEPPSAEMIAYMAAEGLSFSMRSLPRYGEALRAAGFLDVQLRDRNAWYAELVSRELETLRGPLFEPLCRIAGRAETERNVLVWERLCVVVKSGEHRPGHFRARKGGGTGA